MFIQFSQFTPHFSARPPEPRPLRARMPKQKMDLLVVAGPSGTGKTTALQALSTAVHKQLGICSVTSRKQRDDDTGFPYAQFNVAASLFKKGVGFFQRFTLSVQGHKTHYAISKTLATQAKQAGQLPTAFCDLPQLTRLMANTTLRLFIIVIKPPGEKAESLETLAKRLQGRATNTAPEIEARLHDAANQLSALERVLRAQKKHQETAEIHILAPHTKTEGIEQVKQIGGHLQRWLQSVAKKKAKLKPKRLARKQAKKA